jgi:hypothetical protein
MDDEAKTVADYKIVENGFIVMMTVKVSLCVIELEVFEHIFEKGGLINAYRLRELSGQLNVSAS